MRRCEQRLDGRRSHHPLREREPWGWVHDRRQARGLARERLAQQPLVVLTLLARGLAPPAVANLAALSHRAPQASARAEGPGARKRGAGASSPLNPKRERPPSRGGGGAGGLDGEAGGEAGGEVEGPQERGLDHSSAAGPSRPSRPR